METLLIIAAVIIVALIVIAIDQASQLELERLVHKTDRLLWDASMALAETAIKIGDINIEKWHAWAEEAYRINEELSQQVAELQGELTDRFMDQFSDDEWGWGPDGEETDPQTLADDLIDYKRAEDVVVTNSV